MRNPLRDYVVCGERLPSVTEIITLGGVENPYAGVDEAILRRAAQRGQEVHWVTEQLDLRRITTLRQVPLHRRGYAQGYCYFCFRERYVPWLTEKVVISRRHNFAGRPDRCCFLHDDLDLPVVLDVKAVDDEEGKAIWGYQTAGYEIALRETYGITAKRMRRVTLELLHNGSYRMHEWDDPRDLAIFIEMAAYVNDQLERGKLELPEVVIENDDQLMLEAA